MYYDVKLNHRQEKGSLLQFIKSSDKIYILSADVEHVKNRPTQSCLASCSLSIISRLLQKRDQTRSARAIKPSRILIIQPFHLRSSRSEIYPLNIMYHWRMASCRLDNVSRDDLDVRVSERT